MDNTYFAKPGIKPKFQEMGTVVQDPEVLENLDEMGNALKKPGYTTKLRSIRR